MWGIASVAGPLLGGAFTLAALSISDTYANLELVTESLGDGVSISSKSSASTFNTLYLHCFSLPIGAISVVVIQFVLHIDRENNPENLSIIQRILKLDLIGASILVPTVIMLLLALQWGGSTYAWNSAKIIGLFVGAAAMAILFVASQIYLGDKGTLPPRLFKNRDVVFAMAFAFFFGAGFFAIIYYLGA